MEPKKNLNSSNLIKGIRVHLTFNDKQTKLIDTLVGEIGDDRADVVKTIFLTWLSEKGITPSLIRQRLEIQ